MWEHLFPDLVRIADGLLESKGKTARRLSLKNGSSAAVLTQSQRAVRGLRVQKLRCDEVEMFNADIWEAAQLGRKSKKNGARGRPKTASESTGEEVLDLPAPRVEDRKMDMKNRDDG